MADAWDIRCNPSSRSTNCRAPDTPAPDNNWGRITKDGVPLSLVLGVAANVPTSVACRQHCSRPIAQRRHGGVRAGTGSCCAIYRCARERELFAIACGGPLMTHPGYSPTRVAAMLYSLTELQSPVTSMLRLPVSDAIGFGGEAGIKYVVVKTFCALVPGTEHGVRAQ